jgi:succinyl-CoA synthetase beta subunit
MKIHEYQAKEILARFGVPVPSGRMATSAEQAFEIAKSMKTSPIVVKAQIHAGGRGKGGGVKLCKTPDEAKERAKDMLGMQLKTHQTGPEGQTVRRLLIEEGVAIEKEIYVGLVLDRATKRIALMISSEGGMDIEEVAKDHPEKIQRIQIDPALGLMSYQVRDAWFAMGMKAELVGKAIKMCRALYEAYMATDATIVEVNPMIITKGGDLLALDAKMNFDDNALFRHNDIVELRDLAEEDSKEIEAKQFDLSYIALDGNVGCMVNGAGLAMATMDIIKHFGGEPANFLDVGGGATAEKVTAAFRIILQDPKVHAVFVNIFGGIMKCDVIAQGVIQAARDVKLEVPVVVRLAGTNVELGKKMLAESGLSLVSAEDMADGARKVVKLAAEHQKKS